MSFRVKLKREFGQENIVALKTVGFYYPDFCERMLIYMANSKYEAVRGTNDVLPFDSYKWQYVEKILSDVAYRYGFREVRFPTFEKTELFQRSVGDTTDVVQKEMYTFQTKGETSITLRPEGTASVARLCLQNGLFAGLMPLKLFYIISCFRYEKPQAGRYREFHQFGVELYGTQNPASDCETIALGDTALRALGINDFVLKINSIGCPECRAKFLSALREYFGNYKSTLCQTCNDRFEKNPMRILDCKSDVCKNIAKDAPKINDYLCEECKTHFAALRQGLENLGIPYEVDTTIVRGLDYYTKTVFEFVENSTGLTILAGGRYDGLVNELDESKQVCGLGFASGIERLLIAMENAKASFGQEQKCKIFVGYIGDNGAQKAAKIVKDLRDRGIIAETDISGRSLKAQMKYADKIGAENTLILGDNEVESGTAVMKNMQTGERSDVEIDKLFY